MTTLTLTTDFGMKDGFVGTMKGVIWSICPAVQIADISHSISPQNILEGALVLWRAYSFFPSGSVHIAVIDPGVGTQRRPIAAHLGDHYFVGPDNGLFTPIYEDAEKNGWPLEIVHLTNRKYFLAEVSRTFHGRDIFAPVGAALASGVSLAELGPAVTDPVRLALPKPERTPAGWRAHITVADIFGNLTTDLPASQLEGQESVLFRLLGRELRGLVDSYGLEQPGGLVALVDSEGFVEIAAVNGSAEKVLGAKTGDVVEVIFNS
ncbi:MAG TPA: SAM-dependent chlorinase/fluorinase [Anaerolineales bacterium]|nr:SAM-dependent chlorinase/fluorinase [Anaerolineales bacterium]